MTQARHLKPTETLKEYFSTMRDLARKGAVDDSSLMDYIIGGIPDSSNNKIILYGSKTLSEFKDKLKNYETLLNSKHTLCDTGSQATIINEKTYQKLGYPTLNPSQGTFSGMGRDRVESKGYFQNFITIQNTALPAKIHVVNDETIPLDAIIGIDFLRQIQFTYGRDGIRILRDVDECKNEDVLVNLANHFDEQQCKLDLPHISNSKIRNDVELLLLELHTDASSLGFSAVLFQKSDDGLFHPLSTHYFSRKTTVQQEKYSSYELEVLAIIEALKKFRSYLLSTKFKIITDCDAFQKTMHKKDLPAKIARWALMLEEFDCEVCHRPGRQMKHVEALSRYPIMMISSHDIIQNIKDTQNKDEFISQLKSAIKITPSDEYFLKNEILYKLHRNSELLVVPEMMQREIVLHAHAQGRFASKKTESIVSQEFYIPRLTKIVQDVITNCVPCILSSRKAGKQEGFLHPIPKCDQPLDCYHCDFLGPLPSTNKCYKHLFTVIDSFSKFVWIYPVKSTSTKGAIDNLILQQTTYLDESIEHIQITTGVPRGNGQIERMHETIIPVLTKLTIEEPEKWFKHVHRLQRIMNSATTCSTKFTPFEVLIGLKLKQKDRP
ncbi:transposon Tf2-9 polyprotein [Trichonephila clavipes]|nr:transposon Tf2-9 polyprotein [Trichonephila clavipes]